MERTATWNNIGVDVKKANDVSEVLRMAGLNYEVVKSPVYLSNGYKVPDTFVTRKKGTNDCFGPVGKDYTIIQNEEAYSFIDSIIPEGLKFVKGGETKSMNYIIASLPSQYVLDDKVTPYMIFQNSHSGATTMRAAICPLRIICSNQFNYAFGHTKNKISLRHSANFHDRMNEARQTLMFASQFMNEFAKAADKMAAKKVTREDTKKVIDSYFVISEEDTERRIKGIEERKQMFIKAYNAEDNANFVGTQWGLVNAFTDYITHRPVKNTKNAEENNFIRVTFDTSAFDRFMDIVLENA